MDTDLFALFDIPLDCNDPATIGAAVRKKQGEWSKNSNHPKDGETNRARLGELARWRAVLEDDREREAHRAAVAAERQRAFKERERKARRAYQALVAGSESASDPYITEEQRQQFLADHVHPDGPDQALLSAMIKVPVRAGTAAPPPVAQGLDPTVYEGIERALAHFGSPTLYEFLGVPRDADAATIDARSKELQSEWHRKAADAAKSAANKCLGFVNVHLLDPVKRAQHDASVRGASLKPFLRTLNLMALGGSISPAQCETLIEEALEVGVPRDEALALIRQEARTRGASLETGTPVAPTTTLRCGLCGGANPEGASRCGACGESLKVVCPLCGTETPTSRKDCLGPGCPMSVANIHAYHLDFRRAQASLREREPAVAEMALASAFRLAGKETAEAATLRKAVQKARDEAGAHLDKARQAVRAHRLEEAKAHLAKGLALEPGHAEMGALQSEVQAKIGQARELLKTFGDKDRAGDAVGAECALVEAGAICADLPEVAQAFLRRPPASPAGARASVTGLRVVIEWDPSPSPA